jgi:hypothetical protein
MTKQPNNGNLRVWWIPQIPMLSFKWPVANLVEARLLLDVLAEYDKFQFEHNIKPDYSNTGGCHVFDASDTEDGPDGSWLEWENEDGDTINDISIEEIREAAEAAGGGE